MAVGQIIKPGIGAPSGILYQMYIYIDKSGQICENKSTQSRILYQMCVDKRGQICGNKPTQSGILYRICVDKRGQI